MREFAYFCWKLNTKGKLLSEAASTQGTEWRDLPPLPVPSTVREVLETGDYRPQKAGRTGANIRDAYRKVGVGCLSYCLNILWGSMRKNTRVHTGPPKAQQLAAIERLKDAAAYVIDSKDGLAKGGVPRTPLEGWDTKLAHARISYHGEVVAKAEPLELDRIWRGS